MKKYTATIEASNRSFTVNEDEPVLAAALRQGVMLPYSCKNGTCASCKGRLLEGEIHYPIHPPLGLDEGEEESGFALFCQAVPKSDLQIAVIDDRGVTWARQGRT